MRKEKYNFLTPTLIVNNIRHYLLSLESQVTISKIELNYLNSDTYENRAIQYFRNWGNTDEELSKGRHKNLQLNGLLNLRKINFWEKNVYEIAILF